MLVTGAEHLRGESLTSELRYKCRTEGAWQIGVVEVPYHVISSNCTASLHSPTNKSRYVIVGLDQFSKTVKFCPMSMRAKGITQTAKEVTGWSSLIKKSSLQVGETTQDAEGHTHHNHIA